LGTRIRRLTARWAFVLGGGGGSLGAIQVGMLQALAERRLTPDLAIGASVGSLNGAVVALDPEGAANRLSHAWARMTRQQDFDKTDLLIEGAYEAARRFLEDLHIDGPGLYGSPSGL
jgi:predicted acylesterase/phospholipase RssA